MLNAVPAEMRACPQWIVWQYVWNGERNKWDKIPLSVNSGLKCDVGQSVSWTSFDNACAYATRYAEHRIGVGFVLGYNSGIVGIDFDNVFDGNGAVLNHNHHTTAGQFNSYTEYSPSGTGLHVLVKAEFPHGKRHQGVELYGRGRFFTVTGRVYGGRYTLEARQAYVDELASQIDTVRSSGTVPINWTIDPTLDDATIHNMACSASNGGKYLELWNGNWQQHYTSQSEADISLINILAYYSDSATQVVRMFKLSALGLRDKADRVDYLSNILQRAWDRKPPRVEIPAIPITIPTVPAPVVNTPADEDEAEAAQAMAMDPFNTEAPGMVGYISQWFNAQAKYPMSEINVIGALGVMAAICGRQYQYSGSGLNLYMMLLAKTGTGKEALTDGITRIFSSVVTPPPNFGPITTASVQSHFPAAADFLGNFDLTSGVGIKRSFQESNTLCCVAIATEFAQIMTQLADPKSHQGLKDAKQVMLDFYTKSGEGVTYQGKLNADKSKDIKPLQSPTLSIVAQGTPERFYEALNSRMISDGLLSRFIVVEKQGYAAHNPSHAENARVPDPLRMYITQLCQHVITLRTTQDIRLPVIATPEADAYSERLRVYYRNRLERSANNEVNANLWNRAHQNIIRIAALVAIGCDYNRPVIEVSYLEWANAIIYKQCMLMIEKFRLGLVGEATNAEAEQNDTVIRLLQKWVAIDVQHLASIGKEQWAQGKLAGLMPYQYLQERASNLACFKHDKRGPRLALKMLVDSLVSTGELELAQLGNFKAKYYKVNL